MKLFKEAQEKFLTYNTHHSQLFVYDDSYSKWNDVDDRYWVAVLYERTPDSGLEKRTGFFLQNHEPVGLTYVLLIDVETGDYETIGPLDALPSHVQVFKNPLVLAFQHLNHLVLYYFHEDLSERAPRVTIKEYNPVTYACMDKERKILVYNMADGSVKFAFLEEPNFPEDFDEPVYFYDIHPKPDRVYEACTEEVEGGLVIALQGVSKNRTTIYVFFKEDGKPLTRRLATFIYNTETPFDVDIVQDLHGGFLEVAALKEGTMRDRHIINL